MEIQDVITLILGLGNFGQTFIIFRGWKSQERKDKASANVEEGNSVEKTQAIYDKLTEVLNRELDKMNDKLKQQDILLDTQNDTIKGQNKRIEGQNQTIASLEKVVNDYKSKCSECSHNKAKL